MVRRKTTTPPGLYQLGTADETKRIVEGARRTALPRPQRLPKPDKGARAWQRSSRQIWAMNTIRNSAPRLEIPTKTISGIRPAFDGAVGNHQCISPRWFYWTGAGVMVG
jgi:hypothetical protein